MLFVTLQINVFGHAETFLVTLLDVMLYLLFESILFCSCISNRLVCQGMGEL